MINFVKDAAVLFLLPLLPMLPYLRAALLLLAVAAKDGAAPGDPAASNVVVWSALHPDSLPGASSGPTTQYPKALPPRNLDVMHTGIQGSGLAPAGDGFFKVGGGEVDHSVHTIGGAPHQAALRAPTAHMEKGGDGR